MLTQFGTPHPTLKLCVKPVFRGKLIDDATWFSVAWIDCKWWAKIDGSVLSWQFPWSAFIVSLKVERLILIWRGKKTYPMMMAMVQKKDCKEEEEEEEVYLMLGCFICSIIVFFVSYSITSGKKTVVFYLYSLAK